MGELVTTCYHCGHSTTKYFTIDTLPFCSDQAGCHRRWAAQTENKNAARLAERLADEAEKEQQDNG
jgi:hypothetical protein